MAEGQNPERSNGSAGHFHSRVSAAAIGLCARNGYAATSVEDIAEAAGISRSTFFRQFRSKEDVIFADHDDLLQKAEEFLAGTDEDPWLAICDAAALVFEHYVDQGDLARQRYLVVNAVPALRDKELVTVFRYERLFNRFLRQRLPQLPPLEGIRFSAAIISTNNYFLRELMREQKRPTLKQLRAALDEVRRLHGLLEGDGKTAGPDDVVVAVFPRAMPPAQIAQRIQECLNPQ